MERGRVYYLHGVARSGYESSASGDGHFTQSDFNTIAAWKASTVRISTNQDVLLSDSCHFSSGYQSNLDAAGKAANSAGLNVIFDLHWSDRGQSCISSVGQQEIADQRSIAFWQQMATHYKSNPKVFFELHNEPNTVSWSCGINGCSTDQGLDGRGHAADVEHRAQR